MKITPRAGDYVSTKNMTDEQYHHVARIFIAAGCKSGNYPFDSYKKYPFFGWCIEEEKLKHCVLAGRSGFIFDGRELSLSDLLGDEDAVWSGEGVPPVGTECEFITPAGQWECCKILFVGERLGVISRSGAESSFDKSYLKFRPLKSEREIAIEEMTKFLNSPRNLDISLAEHLYNCGFRRIKDAEK